MNKIKRIILKIITEEDDLVCFFICFLGKCIIICLIVYIFYLSIIDKYESDLDFNFSKQNITEYYQKNNTYPTDINQLDKENLVTINGDMYIYNKDTDHLIEYIPVISEQGKIINFTVKIYDINCNFITKKNYKSEDLNS
ncbi:MAG: hypothetical protein KH045_12200 [Megamonas funiformis]|uniref:hypothetical protein n=1 Tax=Megamonas funiformis TaxID=437897 RepID=UPI001ED1DA04|nr:hypothetical protein [Megamonas funiformis]MBS7213277.1 hypothetical protein [Megamonas funiformis]